MKAEVFAAGFLLVSAGAWFTYAKHTGALNIKGLQNNEQKIVISSDNLYEEMAYTGKISFTEDETAIAYISAGGHLKYTKNEQVLEASSDTTGTVNYRFTQYGKPLPIDSNARKLIAEAVSEMIAWGYDAKERADRIYKKGGQAALLAAMDKLKNDGTKRMYAERIFKSDSLSAEILVGLSKKLAGPEGNDYDKEMILRLYKPAQLQDTTVLFPYLQAVAQLDNENARAGILNNVLKMPLATASFPALFTVVTGLNNDYEKTRLFSNILEKGQMDSVRAGLLLEAIDKLQADHDKEQLISLWISKGTLPADRLQQLLSVIDRMGGDWEKVNMYKKLVAESIRSEDQWASLVTMVAHLGQNDQKTELLTGIAQRMPKTDSLKAVYMKAAKTIQGDTDYGRAVRALD